MREIMKICNLIFIFSKLKIKTALPHVIFMHYGVSGALI
jgi:hypothetical protein